MRGELVDLAHKYKELTEHGTTMDIPVEIYYSDFLCHFYYEGFYGFSFENTFKFELERNGFHCEDVESSIDCKYGIDFFCVDKNNHKFAVQIKPFSFYKSTRDDVISDKKSLCKKFEDVVRRFDCYTYYVFYSKNENDNEVKWLKNGDNVFFTIDQLFEYNPNDINLTFKEKRSLTENFVDVTNIFSKQTNNRSQQVTNPFERLKCLDKIEKSLVNIYNDLQTCKELPLIDGSEVLEDTYKKRIESIINKLKF